VKLFLPAESRLLLEGATVVSPIRPRRLTGFHQPNGPAWLAAVPSNASVATFEIGNITQAQATPTEAGLSLNPGHRWRNRLSSAIRR
jgi:hypothetical protein